MIRSAESGITVPLCLTGGGEMGELIRSIDWSQTGVGPVNKWPQSLCTAVSIMLNTPFAMCIAFGKDFIQLYNDAYRQILGSAKHPEAMGNSTRHTLKEVWHVIGPMFDGVMQGRPVECKNMMLPMNRNGYTEECYFHFAYSPIRLENGKVGGVLVTIVETTDSIHTLKQLEESRQQLQFAIDAAELATWNYYPLTNTFTANKRYEEWFGIPAEQEINYDLATAVIAPKDRERVSEAMKRALDYSCGGRFNVEYTIEPPSGKKKILRALGRAWFNNEKMPYRLNGTLQDITDEVTSRKSIIKSENNLRNIVIQAPVAMCVLKGPEYVVEIANEAMIVLWGTKAEEVLNKPIFIGRPEARGQGLEDLLYQVYSTGEGIAAHERPMYLPRNGKIQLTYINFIYEPLREADGFISGVLAVGTDVTDQVLARKKIEESEQRFRTLAETLPQLVWMTDENGNQQYASSRWKEYTGIEPTGAETWEKIIHPADIQKITAAWEKSIKSGIFYNEEVRLRSVHGEYRWHFVQGEPIRNEEGRIIKWIGAFTDIHDRKTITDKLESLVHERTSELQRSNDDLQQFAHVASHDLKEPLRKIKTFANRIEDDNETSLSEKGKNYLSKVYSASDRLFSMIDGVLKYSTIDAHEQPIEVIDLNKIIEYIKSDLEILIQKQNAIIEYSQLHHVEGFSVLIYQLFYNLINNSLKFAKMEEQLRIFIESKIVHDQGREFVEILLNDNGIGFDQEQAEKIFNPFTRLNSKDKYEGTGLGLALCKKIVQRHNGSISATSSKNKGAAFNILLPVKQDSHA
jgi:PAS domain S-box-containing protein